MKLTDCPTCGYPLTEDEVTGEMKHWHEQKKELEQEIEKNELL